jgi:raffinose synthase
VKAGLEAFKEVGFIPPFLILDDGWQEIKDQMLWEFSPNEKFPDGLGALVRLAKEHYGVQRFGVWHTMQGYWSGVHFSGPLAQRYGVKEVHQARYYQIPGKEDDYEIQTRGLIDKEDVGQFYTNYYRYLKQQGVDTVKVDNQGGLEDFVPDREEALDYANAYQQAVQSAVDREFGGNSIHCMSQSSDIFYALKSAQVVRNSQDYFPAKDESHGHHIHANGMNNIWTSTFCLPDWDMFHSNHFTAEFHAAARAISGGPIYISDVPESVNFELVKKLCTSTGKNLRCDQPALPAEECLFVDCVEEDYLFKVTNRHRGVGLLGLFNCQSPDGGRAIRGYASVTDIPDFSMDGRCVAFSYRNKELRVVEANERMEVTLEPLCYELMSFSPMINGIAPIGLIEKFNSSWVFDSFAPIDSGAAFRLRTGGTILLYTENYPKQVTLEDRDVAFSCAGHHLQIVLPEDTTGLLNIYLG